MPRAAARTASSRPKDWGEMRARIAAQLERQSGAGVEEWNRRARASGAASEPELRSWLQEQGVSGYPQMLLVMERFGYPGYLLKESSQLIDEQYADRPALRPILDTLTALATSLGDVSVQARKTYVTFCTPRRAFALVLPATKARIDLGLRLPDAPPSERMRAVPRGVGQEAFVRAISLTSPEEIDAFVEQGLQEAYRISA